MIKLKNWYFYFYSIQIQKLKKKNKIKKTKNCDEIKQYEESFIKKKWNYDKKNSYLKFQINEMMLLKIIIHL